MKIKNLFPGFRTTCLIVGILNISMAGSMLIEGIEKGMAQFGIPEAIITTEHYQDAMFWVFLHMTMIGVLIILIGILAENANKKLWAARTLVLMHCVYLFLDLSTSDNYFGSALYKGQGSLLPVFVDVLYIFLFLRLSFSIEHKISEEAKVKATA